MLQNVPIAVIGDNPENNQVITEFLNTIDDITALPYLLVSEPWLSELFETLNTDFPHGYIAVLSHTQANELYQPILDEAANNGVLIIDETTRTNLEHHRAELATRIQQMLIGKAA